MSKFQALRLAFGWDRNASDLADQVSAGSSRENVQKVLASLRVRQLLYRGPRFLMNSFASATKVFRPKASNPSLTPYVD